MGDLLIPGPVSVVRAMGTVIDQTWPGGQEAAAVVGHPTRTIWSWSGDEVS